MYSSLSRGRAGSNTSSGPSCNTVIEPTRVHSNRTVGTPENKGHDYIKVKVASGSRLQQRSRLNQGQGYNKSQSYNKGQGQIKITSEEIKIGQTLRKFICSRKEKTIFTPFCKDQGKTLGCFVKIKVEDAISCSKNLNCKFNLK